MDEIAAEPGAKQSVAGMQRRRALRRAEAANRIEGVVRGPETNAIFEAFVRGDVEATDIVPRLKARVAPR